MKRQRDAGASPSAVVQVNIPVRKRDPQRAAGPSVLTLPMTIDTLGVSIAVRYASAGELPDGAKGFWRTTDESAGEVVLRPGLPPVGEFIVLVHELLHAMDDILKANGSTSRRVAHAWIEGGAFGLATMLIFLGVVKGLTPEMWDAFVDEVGPDEMTGGRA